MLVFVGTYSSLSVGFGHGVWPKAGRVGLKVGFGSIESRPRLGRIRFWVRFGQPRARLDQSRARRRLYAAPWPPRARPPTSSAASTSIAPSPRRAASRRSGRGRRRRVAHPRSSRRFTPTAEIAICGSGHMSGASGARGGVCLGASLYQVEGFACRLTGDWGRSKVHPKTCVGTGTPPGVPPPRRVPPWGGEMRGGPGPQRGHTGGGSLSPPGSQLG